MGVYASAAHSKTITVDGLSPGSEVLSGRKVGRDMGLPEARLPAGREASVDHPWRRGEFPDHGHGRAPDSTTGQAKWQILKSSGPGRRGSMP